METGITNISRTINQMPSESDKLQSAKKQEGVQLASTGTTEVKGSTGVESEREDPVSEEQLTEVVTKLNETFQNERRSIQFNVDDVSGRTIIKVVDMNTGDEIKQIPSEDVMKVSRRLAEQMQDEDLAGLLLKGSA